MQKRILTPGETGILIPHWYELDPYKISRINKVYTRNSRYRFGPKTKVMDVPSILIDDTGYILNGKHRAYWAVKLRYNLETCIVSNDLEIRFHVPRETFGDLDAENIVDSLERKKLYIQVCNGKGIFTINDLIERYKQVHFF